MREGESRSSKAETPHRLGVKYAKARRSRPNKLQSGACSHLRLRGALGSGRVMEDYGRVMRPGAPLAPFWV